jgi:hypothetical protein
MKKILIIIYLVVFGELSLSQRVVAQEHTTPYNTDLAVGVNFNTMAGWLGGINGKYSIHRKKNNYQTFWLELTNIKHPKEDSRPALATGETYTPGKLNYLAMLRTHYGREWILFRPMPEQGVQINWINTVGATIGLEIPYYIDYVTLNNPGVLITERYNPATLPSFDAVVRSKGMFGNGLQELSFVPGASFRSSVSFRFGAFGGTAVGLEGGICVDVMSRPIQMMAFAPSQQIYQTFFLTLFYSFYD